MWAQVDIRGSEKLAWLKYALRQKAARGDVVHQPLDGSGSRGLWSGAGSEGCCSPSPPPSRVAAGPSWSQASVRPLCGNRTQSDFMC